jgi:hypothetical protein
MVEIGQTPVYQMDRRGRRERVTRDYFRALVFCDVGITSVSGDMLVSRKCTIQSREAGWHRGIKISSLTVDFSIVRDFFYVSEADVRHKEQDVS